MSNIAYPMGKPIRVAMHILEVSMLVKVMWLHVTRLLVLWVVIQIVNGGINVQREDMFTLLWRMDFT